MTTHLLKTRVDAREKFTAEFRKHRLAFVLMALNNSY